MSDTKTKEPLIRIIKRDRSSFGYKVWVRAAAIILALVVDAIFIYSVTGLNPLSVYGVMLNGTFMTSIRFSWAMRDLVTLLCIGIALAPAFKMRFWNIGAEGQVLVGGLATAMIMVKFGGSLPTPMLFLVMFLFRFFLHRCNRAEEHPLHYHLPAHRNRPGISWQYQHGLHPGQ